MRKVCFLFLLFFIIQHGICQVSEESKYKNLPLQKVLFDLESKFGVTFSYTSEILDEIVVTFDSKNLTLIEVLDNLLLPNFLKSEILDNGYVVITKLEPKEVKICATLLDTNGEPISFANIFIPSLQQGTNSDENGKLNWTPIIYGNETIEISYLGYEKYLTSASYLSSCPTIILKPQEFSFEEILVKEYVTSGIAQSVELNHMVLRPDKINMVPGLTDADVLQMVQLLPGVKSIDESATGLYIHGGSPDQNLILYDGIPIYNGGHFFGMISGFNPSLVEKVDVHRSGFSSNFGGRVSSVIDIQSINTIPKRVKFDAGVNFTHADLSLTIPVLNDKIGLIIGARKSYTNIVETPTYRRLSERVFRKGKLDEVNQQEDTETLDFALGFDFNDYNAKLLVDLNTNNRLSFSFFKTDDNLNFDFTEYEDGFQTNDKLDQNSNGLNVKWERKWNARYSSVISFSNMDQTNKYEFRINDVATDELEIEEANLNDISDKTFNFDNRWKLSEIWDLNFGTQYADLNVQRSYQFDDNPPEPEEDENKIATGYFTLTPRLHKKLNINLGVRWNHMFSTNKNLYEPRLSFQYFPTKTFQIKTNAGYYHQFMSQVIEFNDLGINQNFWVLADEEEDIPVLLSKNISLGMIYYPKSFMVEIEGYFKQQEGLTSNLSSFQIDDIEDFDTSSGTSWGVDLLIKKRWNKWQSWISYSYSRTRYTVDMEDASLTFNAPHDVPHSLRITSQYKTKKWNISLGWNISSGIPYTRSETLNDEEDPEPLYDIVDINTSRLPLSHRLDLSMMYHIFEKDGWIGKIGCSLLNIYNRENIMGREFFSVFEDEIDVYQLQTRDRSMLRFTPNIVFRIGFE